MTTTILYQDTAYELAQASRKLTVDITKFKVQRQLPAAPTVTQMGRNPLPAKWMRQLASNRRLSPANVHIQYRIEDNQLLLNAVRFAGQVASPYILNNIAPQIDAAGNTRYDGLAQPIPYTGKLLIVRDFFRHNCVGAYPTPPLQQIEAYDYVYELVLEAGQVVRATDHSTMIGALRALARQWYGDGQVSEQVFLLDMSEWVEAIYGLEYDLWWLPHRERVSA